MNAELNEQGEIPVRIIGLQQRRQRDRYQVPGAVVRAGLENPEVAIEEKLAAASAAQSLATATDGVVVAVNDDDLF
jgi:hypothetical protein